MKPTRLSLNAEEQEALLGPIASIFKDGPLVGREDDDDPPDDEPDDDDDDNDDDDEPPDDNKDERDPQKKITALESEKERHYKRRKAAEAENEELKRKLKEHEDAKLSDSQKAAKELEETKQENGNLKSTLRQLALHNAFLLVNDVKWHNPKRALASVDLSDVEIDDEGKVDDKALKAAIKKLADEEPYLVAQDDSEDDDKDDTPRERTGTPSSGSTRHRDKKNTERQKLLETYPSLRQHVKS